MEAKIASFCLAVVLLGLLVSSAFALPTQQATIIAGDVVKTSTLTVTGNAVSRFEPDIAEVNLGIEVQRQDATDAEKEVARIMGAVRTELGKTGLPIEIETGYYTIYPVYGDNGARAIKVYVEGNTESDIPTIVGYRAVHTLTVRSKDPKNVGKLIDAAASAGANKVNGITFTLSDGKKEEAMMDALAKATKSAKNKADTIASALGLGVKRVAQVSESSYAPMPYRYYGTGMEMASAAQTEIEPSSVAVSATVTVVFEVA